MQPASMQTSMQTTSMQMQPASRPDRASIAKRNIIPHTVSKVVDPKLHGAARSLMAAKRDDKLGQQLNRRRSVKALVNKGILVANDPHTTQVTMAHRQLKRNLERDHLNHFLASRPSLADLVRSRSKIIEDTMTWTRQSASGSFPSPRNCHSMAHVPEGEGKDGRLFLLGGYGTGLRQSELLLLDLQTLTWNRPMVCQHDSHTPTNNTYTRTDTYSHARAALTHTQHSTRIAHAQHTHSTRTHRANSHPSMHNTCTAHAQHTHTARTHTYMHSFCLDDLPHLGRGQRPSRALFAHVCRHGGPTGAVWRPLFHRRLAQRCTHCVSRPFSTFPTLFLCPVFKTRGSRLS